MPPKPGPSSLACCAVRSVQEVREAAVSLLERAIKRYTVLAPLALPPLLAALAKLPAGTVSWEGGRRREGAACSFAGSSQSHATVLASLPASAVSWQVAGVLPEPLPPARVGHATGHRPRACALAPHVCLLKPRRAVLLHSPPPRRPSLCRASGAAAWPTCCRSCRLHCRAQAPRPLRLQTRRVRAAPAVGTHDSGSNRGFDAAPCPPWPALQRCHYPAHLPIHPPTHTPRTHMQAESEQQQAQAIGACRVLEGRAVWRFVSRDWPASRALMLALLASGAVVALFVSPCFVSIACVKRAVRNSLPFDWYSSAGGGAAVLWRSDRRSPVSPSLRPARAAAAAAAAGAAFRRVCCLCCTDDSRPGSLL